MRGSCLRLVNNCRFTISSGPFNRYSSNLPTQTSQLSDRLPSLGVDSNALDPNFSEGSVLDECKEDVSNYALFPSPTFNFAAYADRSPLLQELIKLGVNLDKVERTKGAMEVVMKLDFDNEVKPLLRFLHDNGVPPDELGSFLTKNPFIFKEDLENLAIRVNYLEAKLFTPDAISRIITKNPSWLSQSTKQIDHRLGFFQSSFSLVGQEVRLVATKMPKLITYPLKKVEEAQFGVIEQMGFTRDESKTLLLSKPKVYTLRRDDAVARFDFAHNEMGLSQASILTQPDILLYRLNKIKERHNFLKSIGKAQYDPTAPGYVSMKALMSSSDTDFCRDVAKTTVFIYNKYLKTL